MKKILIIDRFYFPDEQATSVYLTELTASLKDEFQFEVLCGPPAVVTENNSQALSPSRVYSVPTFGFPKRFLFSRFLNDLSFLVSALFRGIFIPRPDLVLSQTSPPGVWWVGFLLSRWHRAQWVHVFQDIFPDNLKALSGRGDGVFFTCLDKMSSFPIHRANRIIVVGEDMKEKLTRKGFPPSTISQTHNWVDLEFIRPLPKRNRFSEGHQLTEKFVVLYAGNFGRIYNFEDLLDAAAQLQDDSRIQFVLVGEGALKEKLIRECNLRKLRNVSILPFEPRSRLPEVLASADAGVILLQRGMAGLSVPSKIYSLLASGRPILACVEEESDIARMIHESQSGFVIPPGKPEELVQAVKELFEKSKLRYEMEQSARRFAEEKNFQSRAFQDYRRTFREIFRSQRLEAAV